MAVYLKQGAGCKGKIPIGSLNLQEGVHFMQAMLLAAGLGTRLRPYTLIRPKPLFPVLNRPLLLILYDMLSLAGSTRVVVNGHHLSSQVEQAVTGKENLLYQYEPEILGTGGSLRQALQWFGDAPILVMNGDIFHNIDLAALYRHHIQSGNRITMAMHDCPRFNTVTVSNGTIRTFHPGSRQDKLEFLAFTGIHIVDPSIISMIPAQQFFQIIDLYEKLIDQGEKIGYQRVDGSLWQDIGTPKDYLELHAKLLSGTVQQPLPVKVPSEPWLVSSQASLGGNIQLSGWGCIGKADIGKDVHLHNCVVWDDVIVPDGARLEDVILSPS